MREVVLDPRTEKVDPSAKVIDGNEVGDIGIENKLE